MTAIALFVLLQTDLDALVERLGDDDIAVREAVQEELARHPIDALRQCARTQSNPEVKGRLIAMVRRLRGEWWDLWTAARFDEALLALAEDEGADDPAAHVQARARQVDLCWRDHMREASTWWVDPLAMLEKPSVGAAWIFAACMRELAGDRDERRSRVIWALTEAGCGATLWVTPMLRSPSREVRLHAASVLGNIKDDRALDGLKRAYRNDSEDAQVKKYIAEALYRITRKPLAKVLEK